MAPLFSGDCQTRSYTVLLVLESKSHSVRRRRRVPRAETPRFCVCLLCRAHRLRRCLCARVPADRRRLTQRNCAASSAETNGSGVRRTCLDSLAVVTAAGAEKVSALSPVSPPVAASSGMGMIDMSDSVARYVETGVGCRCCELLGIASADFEGNESTARREACRLEDAV